jgi:hypothetical protein
VEHAWTIENFRLCFLQQGDKECSSPFPVLVAGVHACCWRLALTRRERVPDVYEDESDYELNNNNNNNYESNPLFDFAVETVKEEAVAVTTDDANALHPPKLRGKWSLSIRNGEHSGRMHY